MSSHHANASRPRLLDEAFSDIIAYVYFIYTYLQGVHFWASWVPACTAAAALSNALLRAERGNFGSTRGNRLLCDGYVATGKRRPNVRANRSRHDAAARRC